MNQQNEAARSVNMIVYKPQETLWLRFASTGWDKRAPDPPWLQTRHCTAPPIKDKTERRSTLMAISVMIIIANI